MMDRTLPRAESDQPAKAPIAPPLICTHCHVEMRLFGIESENQHRNLYTFECAGCGALGVRTVQVC